MKRAVLADAPQVYSGEALFKSREEQLALAQGAAGHRRWLGSPLPGAVRRWPHLRALVLVIPPVCPVADDYAARWGVQHRLTAVAADMWKDPFPAGDVHFYPDIFHDWPVPRGVRSPLPRSGL